jgi:hypothetical protein
MSLATFTVSEPSPIPLRPLLGVSASFIWYFGRSLSGLKKEYNYYAKLFNKVVSHLPFFNIKKKKKTHQELLQGTMPETRLSTFQDPS